MSKDSRFDKLAAEAAARIAASDEVARQLTLLPGEAEAEALAKGRGKARRAKGLGHWLRAQGYQDPGERLATLAGLDTSLDAVTAAIARAEQAAIGLGIKDPEARMELFRLVFATQLRALEALAPYVHAKASPEAPSPPAVQVFVTAPPRAGDGARLVNPGAEDAAQGSAAGLNFAPPPLPVKSEQNQGDAE